MIILIRSKLITIFQICIYILEIMSLNEEMWVEWIPNISTGDEIIVQNIVSLLTPIPALYLLHVDRSMEVNRTVFTLAGTTISLTKALAILMTFLEQNIDMTIHLGTHPRIGALDVSPYVLLKNGSKPKLKRWLQNTAREISQEYNLPVYMYEQSAASLQRENLAAIRKGEYEGLRLKLLDPDWQPDFGTQFHARLGGSVMGMRDFLIAYNVNLDTTDMKIAKMIARDIRSTGNSDRPHRLPGLKAIGWHLEESGFCQISTNITQTENTTPLDVFKRCQWLAKDHGCTVTGSELIGLIPYHSIAKMQSEEPISTVGLASRLGLGYCDIHDLKERIIEHKVYIASGKSLFNEIFDRP